MYVQAMTAAVEGEGTGRWVPTSLPVAFSKARTWPLRSAASVKHSGNGGAVSAAAAAPELSRRVKPVATAIVVELDIPLGPYLLNFGTSFI